MNLKEKIINFTKELGINVIGFTKCRVFEELTPYLLDRIEKNLINEFEEQDIEKRVNPFLLFQEGKTIISIAFPYNFNANCEKEYKFSKYTLGYDYHKVVKAYLDKICIFIEELGGKALPFVDSNPLPERYIAYLSGVGFIGKNNTLITKEYGSYVFLGEIITDLAIEEDKPLQIECGQCDLCLKECPTNAIIKHRDKNNSNICLSYITQKKHVEDKWLNKLENRIFGCDTCQDVCPYNKTVLKSNFEEFKPQNYMESFDLQDLIFLNNKDFKEKFVKHSCGWRGKNIIIRNALISYYNKHKVDKHNIEKAINSPYIREYYDKLFNKDKG